MLCVHFNNTKNYIFKYWLIEKLPQSQIFNEHTKIFIIKENFPII